MRKPKPSIFKTIDSALNYYKALAHYHYLRACDQVCKGKIRSITDYKYYKEFIKNEKKT